MDALISDRGSYEVSRKVTDFLRSLLIADYQSEPCHQHQNKAKQCYGTAKCWTNTVGDQHPIGGWASNMCGSCSTSHLLSHLEVFAHPSPTWPDSDIFFFLHFQFDEPVCNMLKPGAHPRVGNPEVTGIPQVDSSTRQRQLISTHAEVTYLTKPPITTKPVVHTN